MENDRLNQIVNVMEVSYFGAMAALGALGQAPESFQKQLPVWLTQREPLIAALAFGCLVVAVLAGVGEKLFGAKTSIGIGILGFVGLVVFALSSPAPTEPTAIPVTIPQGAPSSRINVSSQRDYSALKREILKLQAENARLRSAMPTPGGISTGTPERRWPVGEQDFDDIAKAQEILDNAKTLLAAAWNTYHQIAIPAPSDPTHMVIPRPPYSGADMKTAYDEIDATKQAVRDAQTNLDNLRLRLSGHKPPSPTPASLASPVP